MIGPPPPYPRIPHLSGSQKTDPDDLEVDLSRRKDRFIAEEKLDGANVVVWRDEQGSIVCAGRSGLGGSDRGRQLGRLRAWVAEHEVAVGAVLRHCEGLYAEWLWRTHSLKYEKLPSWLVVLDLWSQEQGLYPLKERELICSGAGLTTPPRVTEGTLTELAQIATTWPCSRFGNDRMEGVVLRTEAGGPPVAKWVRSDFRRLSDAEWQAGRGHNALAGASPTSSDC